MLLTNFNKVIAMLIKFRLTIFISNLDIHISLDSNIKISH